MNIQESGMSVEQWLNQGQSLFDREVDEYRSLEERLGELEIEMAAKLEAVNQIAAVLGKQPPLGNRRVAVLVTEPPITRPPARHAARSMAAKFGFSRFGSV